MCLQLWAGAVHFPDFWSNVTQRWWAKQLADFHQKMPFDGLWIDMNEASNFCTGDVCYDTGVFPVFCCNGQSLPGHWLKPPAAD